MDETLLRDLFKEEDKHWWHIAKRKLILNFLPRTKKNVLVLGVGGGRLCHELGALGFEVTGIDISPLVCEHVKKTYGISIIQHDLETALPFSRGTFDAIVMTDVLEHIHRDKDLMNEIYRCLKSNGLLLLTVPAYQHMWSYWDILMAHVRRYEYKQIAILVRACGFKIKKITYVHALIYPLAFFWRKFLTNKRSLSDCVVSQGSAVTQALMSFYYAGERCWIKLFCLPFGLSLFVCAEHE